MAFGVRRGAARLKLEVNYWLPHYRANEDRIKNSRWQVKKLRELVDQNSGLRDGPGGWLIKRSEYKELGIPVIRALNVSEHELSSEGLVYISEEKHAELGATEIIPDDLLLTMRGSIGRAAIVPGEIGKANMNAAICRIRLRDRSLNTFVRDVLNTGPGVRQSMRHGHKAVQGDLTLGAIGDFLIPLPDADVRKRLVDALERCRGERADRRRRADELLAANDVEFLNALGIVRSKEGRRKSYAIRLDSAASASQLGAAYHHPERINALNAIRAAAGADRIAKLSEIVNFKQDTEKEADPERYIGMADIESNTGELAAGNEAAGRGQCYLFRKGDVLYGRLRPYLNKVWAADRDGVCSTEFHVLRIKTFDTPIHSDFLAAALRSSLVVAQTKHMMTGNTHPRLANGDVMDLLVPIPDEGTQIEIVAGIQRRREEARRLRQEAEEGWEAGKARFEAELLGAD